MINFLHPCMQPTVHCSTVAADDHTAHNLLAAPNSRQHSAGFVAYAVVRPPVDIVFHLGCAIQLHQLDIWTRVGSLQTTGLEISVRPDTSAEFVKIAHAYDLSDADDGARFVVANAVATNSGDRLKCNQFFRTLHRRLAVRQLRICIKTTRQRCVPALRKVCIYGHPAGCLPPIERQLQLDRWATQTQAFGFYGSADADGTTTAAAAATSSDATTKPTTSSSSSSAADAAASDDIPDDFLDAITCDLMTLPMTLPCGKCVDRTTLERHQRTIASWGRQPSDPFTGLVFSATRRPLLNAALKAQIDAWLLANQQREDVRRAPRTVGSSAAVRKRLHGDGGGDAEVGVDGGGGDDSGKRLRQLGMGPAVECPGCGSKEMLYTIRTCRHWMCRRCLAERCERVPPNLECIRCARPFERVDVVRFHVA